MLQPPDIFYSRDFPPPDHGGKKKEGANPVKTDLHPLAEREVAELQSAIIWLLAICMSNSRARSHLGDNGDDYSPSQM